MKRSALSVLLIICVSVCEAYAQFDLRLPRAALPGRRDTVSLLILGDVMMHARQLEYDHDTFLSGIADSMRAADFCIANLEFSLGGKPYSGYPAFSAPDSYAEYLARDCGTDVFLTANNHILDRGAKGLSRTLAVYSALRDSLGVRYTGSASDSAEKESNYPLMLFSKGLRIALVNFTYGTNFPATGGWPRVNLMDREDVAAAIGRAKEHGADFIIALPHWGTEYSLTHNSTQEKWAEWLLSQGVDAVVGAHPHVVQDTVMTGGRPVIYSLGNVVSNMSAINTRLGMTVTLRFVHDSFTGEKAMLRPQLDFTWCTLPGMLTETYSTIYVKEWAGRRGDWLTPYDFDNMTATLERVLTVTGIDYCPL